MSGVAASDSNTRVRVRVQGIVQGVGFRPHVYRLARQLNLCGYVLNDEHGVLLEIEGNAIATERFLERLVDEQPPLARIEQVTPEAITPTGERTFEIHPSTHAEPPLALVSPDTATCAECLAELNDPHNRRYRYPFINCTNCGPRFTIVTDIPYDRASTTMAGFAMCELCDAEYNDPGDRRFHAQPNACPICGPQLQLSLADSSGRHVTQNQQGAERGHAPGEVIAIAVDALIEGSIVAVKGLGGYHLACRADSEEAVMTLRRRKHREERPFALMCPDMSAAEGLIQLSANARRILQDRTRPIVIAPRRKHARVADAVAPHSRELGVMLPYTPLHHLLLGDFAKAVSETGKVHRAAESHKTVEAHMTTESHKTIEADMTAEAHKSSADKAGIALVMTSGNISDEPIAYIDDDAHTGLAGVADVLLSHNRPIHIRTDDSVVRGGPAGAPVFLRRSRGYVPAPFQLPVATRAQLLACGAELKNTFCVARDKRAWVSHHIGDLKNYETLRSFSEGVEHFQKLFAVEPEVVVHDLHPDYLSTGYAIERSTGTIHSLENQPNDLRLIGVQHHHAHLAACLAEHGELGAAVAAVFDGSGYGPDGTIWGGELLVGDLRDFERAGHLRAVRLPGGDKAVAEPWRMACTWLAEMWGEEHVPPAPMQLAGSVTPEQWQAIAQLARSELAPLTTSIGRLFDAIAALCGVRLRVTYEGQAAIELEHALDYSERGEYEIALDRRGGTIEMDPRAAISEVLRERAADVPVGKIATRFHSGLARTTARACMRLAEEHNLNLVVLSGGVFQNKFLLDSTSAALRHAGLRTLTPRKLPLGDGGISYGQAAVAAARLSGANPAD